MYYVPRGGNRGGADQFNWEDVKEDKGRECYLGHSLMAPVGRWQKNKDLQWFSKERKNTSTASISSEVQAARNAEREAMLIALGHKVGDRLAAETMHPQKEGAELSTLRSKLVKAKKKQKDKKSKKEKKVHKKRRHKEKRKKEKSDDHDETDSSSDSTDSSESERERPVKKRKESKEDHFRTRTDKHSSEHDRPNRGKHSQSSSQRDWHRSKSDRRKHKHTHRR